VTAPELLTEEQAARLLLMSARSLRDLRRQGLIGFVQITARKIAYRPEDCREYVATRMRRQAPPADPLPKGTRRPAKGPAVAGQIVPFSQRNKR